ncbi:MAG: ribosome silencing factor [Actinomycetota bacterium]
MTRGPAEESRATALAAARAALDKQARDVAILDVHEHLVITDLFVLATGTSDRQVRTIVDAVEASLRADGRRPLRREGETDGRWVLLDYGDVVVHVFAEEERDFYDLERLWGDAPRVPVPDAAPSAG